MPLCASVCPNVGTEQTQKGKVKMNNTNSTEVVAKRGRPAKGSTVLVSSGLQLRDEERLLGIMFGKGRVRFIIAK